MSYLGNRKDREANYKEHKLIDITTVRGYGIKRLKDNKFMGFETSKGIISIWNESRKAKLAFAYHTSNTINERADEYQVVEIFESKEDNKEEN